MLPIKKKKKRDYQLTFQQIIREARDTEVSSIPSELFKNEGAHKGIFRQSTFKGICHQYTCTKVTIKGKLLQKEDHKERRKRNKNDK